MGSAQAGAKLFHKNLHDYAPPDPAYETYFENGEEKKVWDVLLQFRRWFFS